MGVTPRYKVDRLQICTESVGAKTGNKEFNFDAISGVLPDEVKAMIAAALFSSAIWSATIAPRYALAQGQGMEDFVIGKPLGELLRWRFQKESADLVWTRAE